MFSQQNPQTLIKPALSLDSPLTLEKQKEKPWWESREGAVGAREGQLHPRNTPVPPLQLSHWKSNPRAPHKHFCSQDKLWGDRLRFPTPKGVQDPQNPSGNSTQKLQGFFPSIQHLLCASAELPCRIPSHAGNLLIGKLSCSWVFDTCSAQHAKLDPPGMFCILQFHAGK